jgi:alpha-tubulin suppressor-like RCC1 family protein
MKLAMHTSLFVLCSLALAFAPTGCATTATDADVPAGQEGDSRIPVEVEEEDASKTETDAANCGTCAPANAVGVCKGASCTIATCNAGYADCDRNVRNGCEALLSSDSANCGVCGTACNVPSNGSSRCSVATCETKCNAGFEVCASGCCLPPSDLPRMDSGDRFSCAVTAAGAVKCWGARNKVGIPGPAGAQPTPVDVEGLSSGVVQVSTGRNHACAVTTAGAVKCWGAQSVILGNASMMQSAIPTDVVGLSSGVRMVGAGHLFSCALLTTGGVTCWGARALGNGAPLTTSAPTPVTVLGISDAVMISTGYSHACALSATGVVKCWGDVGSSGATTPVVIAGLGTNVRAIASGQSNTLALRSDGTVMEWSANNPVPAAVPSLNDAVQVSADYTHACAVTSTGAAKCWGSNGVGQLGRATGTGVDFVTGLTSGVQSIHAGDWHTCAMLTTGAIMCWGQGSEGQLGNGGVTRSSVPVSVRGF